MKLSHIKNALGEFIPDDHFENKISRRVTLKQKSRFASVSCPAGTPRR